MEWLIMIAVLLAWIFGPRLLASTAKASWRAATGKGSFGSNFEASFVGMSAMQTRLRRETVEGERHSFEVFRIEIKGLLPIRVRTDLVVSASVFDVTEMGDDGKPKLQPVTCFLDNFQERDSICYQDVTPIGVVEPDTGFVDWQSVAAVIPDTLTGPRSGNRQFRIYLSFYDKNDAPVFTHGFRDGSIIAAYVEDFSWNVKNAGYTEVSEKRRRAEELTLQAAMAVALADGSLAKPEGVVMQRWLSRRLDIIADGEREQRRQQLNDTMKRAYAIARAGQLDLSKILQELADVGDPAGKLDAVELCLDVLSADGHADQEELKQVQRMAAALDVELDRFHEMRDKRLSSLSSQISTADDYYALLGMEREWDKAQIRSHLNKLYTQWNSRAESLQDPEKRAQAERMLETIAAARQVLLA